jgi:hypothetical protein
MVWTGKLCFTAACRLLDIKIRGVFAEARSFFGEVSSTVGNFIPAVFRVINILRE